MRELIEDIATGLAILLCVIAIFVLPMYWLFAHWLCVRCPSCRSTWTVECIDQQREHGEPEWHCCNCQIYFNIPDTGCK